MGEIHIVEGDLESFAKTVGDIPGERLNSVDSETSLREATLGMPGSDSKAYAAGYGAAVNEECKKASAGFKKFKENMLAAAAEYSQAEDDTTAAWRRFSQEAQAPGPSRVGVPGWIGAVGVSFMAGVIGDGVVVVGCQGLEVVLSGEPG